MKGINLANLARQRNWAHRSVRCMIWLSRSICRPFNVDTYWFEDHCMLLEKNIDASYERIKASIIRQRIDDKESAE